jgi:hypothetical protein
MGSGLYVGAALIAEASTDPLSGNTGWIGAGLLGAVLAWLMFVHLPGLQKQLREFVAEKDCQIRELMKAAAEERQKDRESRQNANEVFRQMLGAIQKQYDDNREVDRKAFEGRNAILVGAIEKQTLAIVAAQNEQSARIVKEMDGTWQKLAGALSNIVPNGDMPPGRGGPRRERD